MARAWKLTIRSGPKVQRSRHATLEAALAALEARMSELAEDVERRTIDLRVRRFEPVQQVAARGEVAGPGRLLPRVRAGVDVRGDGSAEAYVGRMGRALVEQRAGETPCDALRRVLAERG